MTQSPTAPTTENKMILERSIKFEVYPEDAPKLMTWKEATAWAESIGDGWRLPTLDELRMIYGNRDKIPGLITEYKSGSGNAHWYWSCTELRDGPSDVYDVDFSVGGVDWDDKDFISLSSRLVRAELA